VVLVRICSHTLQPQQHDRAGLWTAGTVCEPVISKARPRAPGGQQSPHRAGRSCVRGGDGRCYLDTEQIKTLERDLVRRSKRDYPITQRPPADCRRGAAHGVVLRAENCEPTLWPQPDVGRIWACAGPRPERGTDKQLRISKCGDGLLPIVGERPRIISRSLRPGLCVARLRAASDRHQHAEKETAVVRLPANCGAAAEPVETRHRLRTPRPAAPAVSDIPA